MTRIRDIKSVVVYHMLHVVRSWTFQLKTPKLAQKRLKTKKIMLRRPCLQLTHPSRYNRSSLVYWQTRKHGAVYDSTTVKTGSSWKIAGRTTPPLRSWPLTDVIFHKLNEYFEPKRNTIYERYVFNSRCQKGNESFDQFLTRLQELATTFQFGTFEDEMLRDRIVTGIRDHWRPSRTPSSRNHAYSAKGYRHLSYKRNGFQPATQMEESDKDHHTNEMKRRKENRKWNKRNKRSWKSLSLREQLVQNAKRKPSG